MADNLPYFPALSFVLRRVTAGSIRYQKEQAWLGLAYLRKALLGQMGAIENRKDDRAC